MPQRRQFGCGCRHSNPRPSISPLLVSVIVSLPRNKSNSCKCKSYTNNWYNSQLDRARDNKLTYYRPFAGFFFFVYQIVSSLRFRKKNFPVVSITFNTQHPARPNIVSWWHSTVSLRVTRRESQAKHFTFPANEPGVYQLVPVSTHETKPTLPLISTTLQHNTIK